MDADVGLPLKPTNLRRSMQAAGATMPTQKACACLSRAYRKDGNGGQWGVWLAAMSECETGGGGVPDVDV